MNESTALRPYLPRGTVGHVLITSRNPLWRGVASALPVRVFARADAVAFLLQRTGDTDAAAATTLAEMLGDLPLALEQVGAYVEATGISLAAYLQRFTTSRQALLRRGTPSTDYPDTVATTWEMAMQRVQREQSAAADLIHLCAFLAPDDIPCDLFRDGCEHLPETMVAAVTDPLTFDEAIAVLRRYSLEYSETFHVAAEETGELLDDVGGYLQVRGQFNEARALAIGKAMYGPSHPTVAIRLNNLGHVLRDLGELAAARAAYERAVQIFQTFLGVEHPSTKTAQAHLDAVIRASGASPDTA